MTKSYQNWRVAFAGYSVMALAVLLLVEGSSFFFFQASDNFSIWRERVFHPYEVSEEELQNYLVLRNDRLGWVEEEAAPLGPRMSPANDAIEDSRVCFEFYGDSFTHSSEIDNEGAWANQVARKTSCRVLNFGVRGYGVDQAVLRHEGNAKVAERAGLVIYRVNIRRNLNQYSSLFSRNLDKFTFKPRFILSEEKGIELVPMFDGEIEDYREVVRAPWRRLKHERYLPGSKNIWAKVKAEFPYSLSLLRLAKKVLQQTNFARIFRGEVKSFRERNYANYDFQDKELALEAKLVLEGIVERFLQNCASKKQDCYVFFLPDVNLLIGNTQTEKLIAYYFEEIDKRPEFRNIMPYLQSRMPDNPCQFFARDCKGHFTREGYEILSQYFVEEFPEAFLPE